MTTVAVFPELLTREIVTTYRTLIRRNAVYLTSIFVGAFAFEVAFDTTTNKLWDTWNRGRQWKDIKHQYINKAEEEDDE
ncbi:ubiquinol-cytochrome C reductase [Aspergillus navahoensis]